MRKELHKLLSSIPARFVDLTIGIGGICASLWPDKLKHWADSLMSAEQIRLWGLVSIVVAIVYWVLLRLIQPKEAQHCQQPENVTFGNGSHILTGNTFNGPVHLGETQDEILESPIGLTAMLIRAKYVEGESVRGIRWKNGYQHLILRILNLTDETYSELNVIIEPEMPIIAATCRSDLAEPKIGLIGVSHPTLHRFTDESGRETAYSEEPHPENITIGPPYRLYCMQLPGRAEIRVDLATIEPTWDIFSSEKWYAEGKFPDFVDVHASYKAYGQPKKESQRIALVSNV